MTINRSSLASELLIGATAPPWPWARSSSWGVAVVAVVGTALLVSP
ncbi:hypothetical protein [Nocardioides sp. InS609-2]|nr:hypothetical protein [Nocardioides sp. InS609-2]